MPVPLWLHLKLSGLNRPSALPERLPPIADRPAAPIWIRVSEAAPEHDIETVLQLLSTRLPEHPFVVTGPAALVERLALPRDCHPLPDPADTASDIHAALGVWKPALVLLLGRALPPGLISGAQAAGIPVMLAACTGAEDAPYAGRLLRLFHTILAQDRPETLRLIARGAPPNRLITSGPLTLPPAPLPCSGAELAAMGSLLQNRPTWFAASVPESELEIVLTAHRQALRQAHRLLLILAPEASGDAIDLAQRLTEEGWHVARRSLEGEPDQHTQIFIADDAEDYGLWYRLAPVTYFGGSFAAAGCARSPYEAASLGSAILHGPEAGRYPALYQSLQAVQGSKRLQQPEDLPEAVTEFLAPHRSAFLSYNAWDIETAGAGAFEDLVSSLCQCLKSP
ncbi:glycosyltransferase N-terminal domain-containing protein [Thioclava sp. GXIMD2076]|uniref:3-deoxy-D-manno-octulosonic acid transferase n=1 Tax=unclassified Thioclava TaxID=2621713 RepID=UPI0030CFB7B2